MASDAWLLAFFIPALELALGARLSIALPRLTVRVPVTLALSASKPPGMSRFLARWAAATHWPRFLKPLHAVCASRPVSVLILPAMAVLWFRTSLGEACEMSVCAVVPASRDSLTPGPLPVPCVAGGPPPGCGRC